MLSNTQVVGWTTSGSHFPVLGEGLAMASLPVSKEYLQIYNISTQYIQYLHISYTIFIIYT